ncbi:hypothetical protein MTBBW1_1730021 [Desulfamplus magnetovallimortis]|uniref:DNA binding HTH domain-containing protein n=1 Tax=Desulfamplus magnetovallimortis TaxID=1246637 RepID=A0A1W1H9U8_9BACT|nr:helix-turn-helix domain-containing protein [Desulfamplus magnetovallimortis]SLM29223.1 hypothetical protein MTBBW1_1730021 [Desulfamplus magnetovallimortis]
MIYNALGNYQSGTLSLDVFKYYIEKQQSAYTCLENINMDEIAPFPFARELPTIKKATEYLVLEAMKRASGNQTVAAKMLGISQPALSNRLKKISILQKS